MPNDYIDNIKTELENQFKPESCIKKEPFIKLGTGQAPVLDYNIPQTACFNTYGHQYVKGIDQQVFKQQTKVKPPNNYLVVPYHHREVDKMFSYKIAGGNTTEDFLLIFTATYLNSK